LCLHSILEIIMYKLILSFVAIALVVVAAGAAWNYHKSASPSCCTEQASCCAEGAACCTGECCFEGSPCCTGECCFEGSPCCFEGSPCCDGSCCTGACCGEKK
jgi:hypothetical protein